MPAHSATALSRLCAATAPILLSSALSAQCNYTWEPGAFAGGCNDVVNAVLLSGDRQLYFGGRFTVAGAVGAPRVARWDGSAWQSLGAGTSGEVRALAEMSNGDIVAAGDFAIAGNVVANGVARWDGTSWSALGSGLGLSSGTPSARALLVLPNGDLIVGGDFDSAGAVSANNIARWDGANWTALGSGCNDTVHALAHWAQDQFFVAGDFTLVNGSSALGIARGTNSGLSPFGSLGAAPGGRAICSGWGWHFVGGTFTFGPFNRVAQLGSGSNLTALNAGVDGPVQALQVLVGGVVAGGTFAFADGQPANNIARWDGAAWNALGAGANGEVRGMVLDANRDLVVVGAFTAAGGSAAGGVARVRSSCATQVTQVAPGCTGPAGPIELAVDQVPSLGREFRATCTGYAPASLGLAITGLNPLTPTPVSLFTPSYPGCVLGTLLDFSAAMVPVGGRAESSLPVPTSLVLLGFQFFHQHAMIELDSNNTIEAIGTSDAVRVTIGRF